MSWLEALPQIIETGGGVLSRGAAFLENETAALKSVIGSSAAVPETVDLTAGASTGAGETIAGGAIPAAGTAPASASLSQVVDYHANQLKNAVTTLKDTIKTPTSYASLRNIGIISAGSYYLGKKMNTPAADTNTITPGSNALAIHSTGGNASQPDNALTAAHIQPDTFSYVSADGTKHTFLKDGTPVNTIPAPSSAQVQQPAAVNNPVPAPTVVPQALTQQTVPGTAVPQPSGTGIIAGLNTIGTGLASGVSTAVNGVVSGVETIGMGIGTGIETIGTGIETGLSQISK